MATPDLDDVDRRLLHRLAEDLPVDVAVLGAQVDVPADEAARRLARLVSLGVVREAVAHVDAAAVGVGFTAFLLVRVAQTTENYAVIRQMLGDLEAVEEAHAISGDFDWLLKVRSSSLAGVQALVTGQLSLVPGFIRAQTCVVLDTACDYVNADVVRLAGA